MQEKGEVVLKTLLVVFILAVCAVSVGASAPMDVPQDHWAYKAVSELASKGLVQGYPDGNFLGDRSLTKYEFATLVARVVGEIDNRIAQVTDKITDNNESVKPITPEVAEKIGVSKVDLETINKLIEEFKVEMTVIGVRIDKVEATVNELKSQVETHDAILNDEEGTMQTMHSDVSKLKKIGISGYVQARYQNINIDKENEREATSYDTFLVRRARVKVTATPSARSTAVLQLDLGKNAVSVKDAYFQLALGKNSAISASFLVGQQNWWFGYEVPYSSSKRETPERALFVRRFFPGERDQGFVLKGATDKSYQWHLGVYNGTGTEKNSAADLNDAKDVLANVKFSLGDMDLGVSGYHGKGAWKKFGEPATYFPGVVKNRYGADLQYYMNNITLKAEYIGGKGFDEASPNWNQNQTASGYYAQMNYNINPSNIFVARYSSMSEDPQAPQYGRRSSWDLGAIHWLDDKSRLKFFYKINNEQNDVDDISADNDGYIVEWITVY